MKALVLISGGLDSSLTVRAIQKQGIEVLAVHFLTPFSPLTTATIHTSRQKKIAEQLGCEFKAIDLGDEYLQMLKNPKYGYGKHTNPCIDCKIFMLKKAKNLMNEVGASFVATGEVLGQRPMSQHKRALQTIEQESGLTGLLLRPLSALLLPATIPQKEGWLKQEFLFDIDGRSRKRQLALAKEWGIEGYSWPGGGCLLTDKYFSKRLDDLIAHEQLSLHTVELAKIGRYFRISPSVHLSVGRNEEENKTLLTLTAKDDIIFSPLNIPGPILPWPGECAIARQKVFAAR